MNIVEKIAELVRKTSSTLPEDALKALKAASRREKKGSSAWMILNTLVKNAALSSERGTPMCQDTGTLTFFIDSRLRRKVSPAVVGRAVEYATEQGWLRRNTIDSVSARSVDTNVCDGAPVIHYVDGDGEARRITLIMKGGGSENMSRQYSLPDSALGAGRDLEGVRRCVLDAVHKAQGYGCAPGILGVCIGGDRAGGYAEAKHQLLRQLDDVNGCPELARLERRILKEANSMGIGPMGLGGKTTLLGVKIGSLPRVPASFFVTVAYLCWAARRQTVEL
jgi:fumarate hydratase class I